MSTIADYRTTCKKKLSPRHGAQENRCRQNHTCKAGAGDGGPITKAALERSKAAPPVRFPNLDAIPAELRALDHFVLWRYDWNEARGCWTKVPLHWHGKLVERASSTDPAT